MIFRGFTLFSGIYATFLEEYAMSESAVIGRVDLPILNKL